MALYPQTALFKKDMCHFQLQKYLMGLFGISKNAKILFPTRKVPQDLSYALNKELSNFEDQIEVGTESAILQWFYFWGPGSNFRAAHHHCRTA